MNRLLETMTVCTACIFLWFYPDATVGPAILAASDRMLSDTGLGIEYESSRWKALSVDAHHMIFVAGDLTFNTVALSRLVAWAAAHSDLTTFDIAEAYGSIVSACAFERAVKRNLEPLGITLERVQSNDFKWQDAGLSDALLGQILDQLQAERVDCEAMVIGCDEQKAHLYRVDSKGVVTQHDDVGFLSIGSGGIHASGYYMQAPYNHVIGYHQAMLLTYFGKKRAEVAPGVGSRTDMFLITRDGAVEISQRERNALEKAFVRSQKATDRLRPSLERGVAAASQKEAEARQSLPQIRDAS